MNTNLHWENVFTNKAENEVSWFQPNPKPSIDAFLSLNLPKSATIIEVGGGDSYFIDALLNLGYTNLTLLDISASAIERAKKRLGDKAQSVTFIVTDILDFKTDIKYDFWHDRASFHFQTEKKAISKYVDLVTSLLSSNGFMLLGTFSKEGPTKCSGLPITQYDALSLKELFKNKLEQLDSFNHEHLTPFNTSQHFVFSLYSKL